MRGFALLVTLTAVAPAAPGCDGDDRPTGPRAILPSPNADVPCGILWDVWVRLGDRVRGATPDAMRLSDYRLLPDGTFTSPAGITCTDTIAAALTDLCPVCDVRPMDCEPLVRGLFTHVPAVCSRCGDEVCYFGESAESCAPDCATRCGDGLCSPLEQALTCPIDCAEACGDGLCAGGEDPTSCPIDCRYAVGDGVCEPGENPHNSPQDCGFATCGDGFCQSYEDAQRCPEDCCTPAVCEPGMRRCLDSGHLAACVPSGQSFCPELIEAEPCPLGCLEDPPGDAHCRTCLELNRDFFPDGRIPCAPGPPTCQEDVRATCVPLPGFPSCGFLVTEPCAHGCAGGACIGPCEPCAPGATRCAGDVLETCVQAAPTCTQWTPGPSCAMGCVADAPAHCRTCAERVADLGQPDLGPGCPLGAPPACAPEGVAVCAPIDDQLPCGHRVVTPCPEGEACLGDGQCAPCAPNACGLNTHRCKPGVGGVVEACVPGVGCVGWATVQTCPAGWTCVPEGDAFAYCADAPP